VFFHKSTPSQVKPAAFRKTGEGQTFTGIGTIRVSTADTPPGMAVLFVSFIYYPEDKAFSEELALRVKDFRQIIVDYFSSFPASELRSLDEENIKSELLLRFNSILRLGKIEALYFGDFMIIN
jgi:flagellar basal body-associated protein FliL